jgi:ATP-dependent Zn protease
VVVVGIEQEVDDEVERLVSHAYDMAKEILISNKDLLYALSDRLVRRLELMRDASEGVRGADFWCGVR